jgi:hypothetical protein
VPVQEVLDKLHSLMNLLGHHGARSFRGVALSYRLQLARTGPPVGQGRGSGNTWIGTSQLIRKGEALAEDHLVPGNWKDIGGENRRRTVAWRRLFLSGGGGRDSAKSFPATALKLWSYRPSNPAVLPAGGPPGLTFRHGACPALHEKKTSLRPIVTLRGPTLTIYPAPEVQKRFDDPAFSAACGEPGTSMDDHRAGVQLLQPASSALPYDGLRGRICGPDQKLSEPKRRLAEHYADCGGSGQTASPMRLALRLPGP